MHLDILGPILPLEDLGNTDYGRLQLHIDDSTLLITCIVFSIKHALIWYKVVPPNLAVGRFMTVQPQGQFDSGLANQPHLKG